MDICIPITEVTMQVGNDCIQIRCSTAVFFGRGLSTAGAPAVEIPWTAKLQEDCNRERILVRFLLLHVAWQ